MLFFHQFFFWHPSMNPSEPVPLTCCLSSSATSSSSSSMPALRKDSPPPRTTLFSSGGSSCSTPRGLRSILSKKRCGQSVRSTPPFPKQQRRRSRSGEMRPRGWCCRSRGRSEKQWRWRTGSGVAWTPSTGTATALDVGCSERTASVPLARRSCRPGACPSVASLC